MTHRYGISNNNNNNNNHTVLQASYPFPVSTMTFIADSATKPIHTLPMLFTKKCPGDPMRLVYETPAC